ncbi:uncharacterized protein [Diadema antillarum]|uniref:uncharacterized protein isoform X2 n=1 Tax=Diadema antillarum TaxID=105358 RepID=UPI003A864BA6
MSNLFLIVATLVIQGIPCNGQNDFDLRLVGSPNPAEGRVEVYRENEKRWGAVCDNGDGGIGEPEADVICRQIGHPAGSLRFDLNLTSVSNISMAFLGSLSCSGSETSVSACNGSVLSTTSCPNDMQATVECDTTPVGDLSPGAIAGIAVGFAIVIIVCCLFSLNCSCQPCWKKTEERDDTGVYECNSGGNKVYSTTSNLKSESESHGNSNVYSSTHDEPDPSLFVYAPKVPVVIMTSPPEEKDHHAEENGNVSGTTGEKDARVNLNDDFVVVTMTTDAVASEENIKSGATVTKETDGDTDKELKIEVEGKENDGEEEKDPTLNEDCKEVTQREVENGDGIPVTGDLLMSSESKAINKNTDHGIEKEASHSVPPNLHKDAVCTVNAETHDTKF